MNRPTLTVIVPAYNEAATIGELLKSVMASPINKQVIAVDDGSRDGTYEVMLRYREEFAETLEVLRHPVNRGKGSAIRTGLGLATGQVVLVQDADLEYDPSEYEKLVEPILSGQAQVVYGSRYLQPQQSLPWTLNRVCVVLLNLLVRILFKQRLTDEATCYKAFRTEVLQNLDLTCERFEFCPEVTAKSCLAGLTIHEVPIQYRPRGQDEGKKIRWWDGVEAIMTLVRWRASGFQYRAESVHARSLSEVNRE